MPKSIKSEGHPSPDNEQRMLGDRLGSWVDERSGKILVGVLALTVFAVWAGSHMKPLWFDEIFTVIVAQCTNWRDMKTAMAADANPPLLAMATKACLRLFGTSEVSIRLPSLLGFIGALFGVYIYVRRETYGLLALLAVCLVLAEPGWIYAYEARPYAMLLCFMMLGLVSWQSATESRTGRTLSLFGIWIAFVLSMLSHNLGLVEVGFPLAMGEIVRSRNRRRIDWPIWASGAASLPVLLFTYPLSRKTNQLLLNLNRVNVYPLTWVRFKEYWIRQPLNSLPLLLSGSLAALLVLVLVLHWSPSKIKDTFSSPALWAGVGAICLIPVTYLIMTSSSGYYNCRYGIGSIAGIAIVFCLLYPRIIKRATPIPLLLMAIILAQLTTDAIRAAKSPAVHFPHVAATVPPAGLPYVVANPFMMMQRWFYATSEERKRLVYLRDQVDAVKERYIIVDVCIATISDLAKVKVSDLSSFVADHDQFFVESDGTVPSKALNSALEADGYVLRNSPVGGSVVLATRTGVGKHRSP